LFATLTQLKRFFQWLAWQPGYKSRVQYADAEYFNLSDKDTRIATAKRQQKFPTRADQACHQQCRLGPNRASESRVVAFTPLTGARD
jgi:hypothetical protein